MKVLGVTCSSSTALVTLVDTGDVIRSPVERIVVGALHEASAELEATIDEITRALRRVDPDRVVLL